MRVQENKSIVILLYALSTAPFGIPTQPFWMYACALVLLMIGFITVLKELPQQHGIEKILPFGRLFFAVSIAVFATEHFTETAQLAQLVPRWLPAHTFWVYFVGFAFLCAGFSMVLLVQARLSAALVGMTFFIFVFLIDMPAVIAHPENRFSWALMLRQLAFSGGAFAFSMLPWSTRMKLPSAAQSIASVGFFPRFFVGIPSIFYGIQHLLHLEYAPGVPLRKLTPEWIPGRILLSVFVGFVLILSGVCFLINKKTRMAATFLGLTILLTVLWIYLPMVLEAPMNVEALNYFFDTLLFCGTILILANAMEEKTTS